MIVNDKENDDDNEKQEEHWAGNDADQLHRAPHGRVLRLLEVTWVKGERRGKKQRVKTTECIGLLIPNTSLRVKCPFSLHVSKVFLTSQCYWTSLSAWMLLKANLSI